MVIVYAFMGITRTVAQTTIHFDQTAYHGASGAKLQANLLIYNTSSSADSFSLFVNAKSLQVIGTVPSRIALEPGDSMLIPVQLYIPRRVDADSGFGITARLQRLQDGNFFQAQASIQVPVEHNIYLRLESSEVYAYNLRAPLEFSLRCVNDGNTAQFVHIHLKNSLTAQLQAPLSSFRLGAFSDTTLQLKVNLNNRVFDPGNPTLVLAGTLEDNSIFSHAFMHVHAVGGRKTYDANEPPVSEGTANSISLFSRYAGSPMQYYQLAANGSVRFKDASLQYNTDLSWYRFAENPNKWVLANTLLNYQEKNIGIQLGNIYHSDEVSVAGRGVGVTVAGSNQSEYTAGYINSTYNLLSFNDKTTLFRPSNLVYTGYHSRRDQPWQYSAGIKKIWDPSNGVNAALGGGTVSFHTPSGHVFTAGGYGSYATRSAKDSSGSMPGGAIQFSYSGQLGKWQLSSFNYVSTSQYAGIQRGAIQFDQRIGYNGDGWDSWMRVHQSRNKPGNYTASYSFIDNEYGSTTAELGYQQRLSGQSSLLVRSYLYKESSYQTFSLYDNNISLTAARLNVAVNIAGSGSGSLALNADGGYFIKAIDAYQKTFAYRLNVQYRYKWFSLQSLLQKGPYYAGEMRMYHYAQKSYGMFMIAPGMIRNFFNNRLTLSVSDVIAYEKTFSRWSNNLSLNAGIRVAKQFRLELKYTEQHYGINQSLKTIDAGIVKHFSTNKRTGGTGSLHASFFDDRNGNNQLDAGEPPVQDILVKIGDEVFVTDANGAVVYRSLPNGSYIVSVYQGKGFVADNRPILVQNKTSVMVPLHRMEIIEGRLDLKRPELSFETDGNISGIKVTATSTQGMRYTAITNEEGRFTIYAPANDYFIQVEPSSLPDKYEAGDPGRRIRLDKNQPANITISIAVKKRQAKVMKFVSQP